MNRYKCRYMRPPKIVVSFFLRLQEMVRRVACGDVLIVMGNMNTRVGNDTGIWGEVLGRQGEEVCNEDGRRILSSAVSTIFNLLELFACR